MAFFMYTFLSDKLRKLARSICAEMSDTQQYTYTNPSNDYPSDITYDTWPGEPSPKQNDPASKKDDEKHKWDYHYIGPGPTEDDWAEKGNRPSYMNDVDPPKTDAQLKVQDHVKSKGDDADELDRETWVGEGIIDKFNF
jgi:hypothetical protein